MAVSQRPVRVYMRVCLCVCTRGLVDSRVDEVRRRDLLLCVCVCVCACACACVWIDGEECIPCVETVELVAV